LEGGSSFNWLDNLRRLLAWNVLIIVLQNRILIIIVFIIRYDWSRVPGLDNRKLYASIEIPWIIVPLLVSLFAIPAPFKPTIWHLTCHVVAASIFLD
jgi:hypothetical protein